jgi:hypothetical protein
MVSGQWSTDNVESNPMNSRYMRELKLSVQYLSTPCSYQLPQGSYTYHYSGRIASTFPGANSLA